MASVSRSDIYMRDERGPLWFEEFLLNLSKTAAEPLSVNELLKSIIKNKSTSVDSVVKDYRQQVGLDLVTSEDIIDNDNIKQSSVSIRQASVIGSIIPMKPAKEVKMPKSLFRPLSIRHAANKSMVDQIKADPQLKAAIESLCRHSGGTKKIQALINYLRDKLGNDVSFSDDGLIEYLNEIKNQFRATQPDGEPEPGRISIDETEHDHTDYEADYAKHTGAQ